MSADFVLIRGDRPLGNSPAFEGWPRAAIRAAAAGPTSCRNTAPHRRRDARIVDDEATGLDAAPRSGGLRRPAAARAGGYRDSGPSCDRGFWGHGAPRPRAGECSKRVSGNDAQRSLVMSAAQLERLQEHLHRTHDHNPASAGWCPVSCEPSVSGSPADGYDVLICHPMLYRYTLADDGAEDRGRCAVVSPTATGERGGESRSQSAACWRKAS